MKAFLKYAERIEKDDQKSVARRKMWPAMVERIQSVFDDFKDSHLAHNYGSLYLHDAAHEKLKHLPQHTYLGHLQLTCGLRRLGLSELVTSKENPEGSVKIVLEQDAAMWLAQSPSGAVSVFVAPYKSSLAKMVEENIILGIYSSPEKLTDKVIRQLFSTFFKYLSITSAHHQQSVSEYAWRLWLMYKDARTKKHEGFIKMVERLLLAAGAVACIWVIIPSAASPAASAQAQQQPVNVSPQGAQAPTQPERICASKWLELAQPRLGDVSRCPPVMPAQIPLPMSSQR
ncbi:hypothetical protein E8E71_29840 [Pseudomonas sp. BN605]|uniref:Uncharacterized protein n=1 Tax=Pseudomonas hunanensis TaxID=1247546 RepID=A0ABD6N2W1_9PSED|nr:MULTISPECIES: hypothetical protein [Pseudomonas]MDH4847917.1 hypothetical protein [Pseudomonas sp. BN605]NWL45656.1 hypothetical protein [Pseudomonas hunanensis]